MQVKILPVLGKTIESIYHTDDRVEFTTSDAYLYTMYHRQECCESVGVDEIIGDLDDLIGKPLLMAEEVSNADDVCEQCHDSFTWTFYKFATIKGYVTIRWLGESNGYYSQSVSFVEEPLAS